MSSIISSGLAFNDPYYTPFFLISLLTFILDATVIYLNCRYNSNKTNILFTAVNVCISSWLRCCVQILTWQPHQRENNQHEPDSLFNLCSILAALGVTSKISQDIWVCILGVSFYSELINPTINESKEDRKKWLFIKIISSIIAVIIPVVIAGILFFNGALGLGTICCWIQYRKQPAKTFLRCYIITIKSIIIFINGFFCIKIFMIVHKMYPLLKDDKQKKDLKKLQIIIFSFPFNQFIEALFSTASTIINIINDSTNSTNSPPSENSFQRIIFIIGAIQSMFYSISFFFFTNGWNSIHKMCNKDNKEVEEIHNLLTVN